MPLPARYISRDYVAGQDKFCCDAQLKGETTADLAFYLVVALSGVSDPARLPSIFTEPKRPTWYGSTFFDLGDHSRDLGMG